MSGISMSALSAATSGAVVSVPDLGVYGYNFYPQTAVAGFILASDGTMRIREGSNTTYQTGANWVDPTTSAGQFEVRATLLSGEITLGALDTWSPLNLNQGWELQANYFASLSGELLLEIRNISTGVMADTATISFTATSEG